MVVDAAAVEEVTDSIVDAWVTYFKAPFGDVVGRDYAHGRSNVRFRPDGREVRVKEVRRLAYVRVEAVVGDGSNNQLVTDFGYGRGQYFSIHAFDTLVKDEGIKPHTQGVKASPDYLCWLYFDIEPKKEGVTHKHTFSTLVKIVEGGKDLFGATPLVMETRVGRYAVLYPLPRKVLGEEVYAYSNLFDKFLEELGLTREYGVTIDTLKDLARVTRIPYTHHELRDGLIYPIELRDGRPQPIPPEDFSTSLWGPLDDSLLNEAIREYREEMRRKEEEFEYLRLKSLFHHPHHTRPRPGLKGKACLSTRDLGRVCYDRSLEGFGWLKYLIKNRIPVPDGRLTLCWYHLPYAIKAGWVTTEEAKQYITLNYRAYPDRSLEEYFSKLERNIKYGYTPPTWRSLLLGVRKDGTPLNEANKHVKAPVVWALMKAGVVSVEKPQALSVTPPQKKTENHESTTETREKPSFKGVISSVGLNPYASVVLEFVRGSGLNRFTYDDFKRWLERREGRLLSASEWQGWERRLRQLVTEGLLGREYLVNGVWVDHGSKEVNTPPSRTVRFYVRKQS